MKKLLFISVLGILFLIPSCSSSSTTPTPASNPPTINSFAVSPTSIYQTEKATLSWSVSNATSVQIDQGIGAVALSGSKDVTPNSSTTYTLTATNSSGSKTATSVLSVKWYLQGNWTGTSSYLGTSTTTFAVVQPMDTDSLSGTWTVTHGSYNNHGTFTGAISGNTMTATLTGSAGYHATANGAISNNGTKIDGTGTVGSTTYTFSIQKQ
jgi:hypothetical protein